MTDPPVWMRMRRGNGNPYTSPVSITGREPAVTRAVDTIMCFLAWLDAAGEIELKGHALLADGKLRVGFWDASGAPQEFTLPTTPELREALRREKEREQSEAVADGAQNHGT